MHIGGQSLSVYPEATCFGCIVGCAKSGQQINDMLHPRVIALYL